MLFIQMTGLSGAGKTTIAYEAKKILSKFGFKTEVIDGDEYRQHISKDLGFSREDRIENIRRLSYIGSVLCRNGIIVIMSAINPFEDIRKEVELKYPAVKTVWVNSSVDILMKRDTKGLYRKALLPEWDKEKIKNLSGVNGPYEIPLFPALIINSDTETIAESTTNLIRFILKEEGFG